MFLPDFEILEAGRFWETDYLCIELSVAIEYYVPIAAGLSATFAFISTG